MLTLFTIGYESVAPDAFVRALKDAGVSTLLDIRAIAWSRKEGFSKEELRSVLDSAGIAYVHLEALGNPQKRGGRVPGDTRSYEDMYNAHLDSQAAQAGLAHAAQLAAASPCCLMCFERDPHHCHRLLTAARMEADFGFTITHLIPDKNSDQLSLL